MIVGHHGPEVPVRFLLANPHQETLKLRRGLEQLDPVERTGQLLVREQRVYLLMAWPAKRRPVLRLAALLSGLQVVLRNQVARHIALAEAPSVLGEVAELHAPIITSA